MRRLAHLDHSQEDKIMTDETLATYRTPGFAEAEGPAWRAAPGQIANWRAFALAGALVLGALALPWPFAGLAVLPAAWAGWRYLVVRCTAYELTSQRLRIAWGVFTRRVEEIELYRVEDSGAVAPLAYRLVGRGNVYALTSDRSAPAALLEAVRDHEAGRLRLRELVEAARAAKGVHLIE